VIAQENAILGAAFVARRLLYRRPLPKRQSQRMTGMEMRMKKHGWKTRFSALALSMTIAAGASTAVADDFEGKITETKEVVSKEVSSKDGSADSASPKMEIVAVKGNVVVTRQTIDGVEVSFEWTLPDEWIGPDGTDQPGVAYGFWDKLIAIGIEVVDRLTDGDKGGGGGGGGGGGNTNNCNVTVTGAQIVVIGNLQCGGTQTGSGGSGHGSGGSGSGGHPQ
jgi:hypothetical protein